MRGGRDREGFGVVWEDGGASGLLAEFGYIQCVNKCDVRKEEAGGHGGGREDGDGDGGEGTSPKEVHVQSCSEWFVIDREPRICQRALADARPA